MKKRFAMTAAMAAIMMLGIVPGHAADQEVTYVAAPGLRISNANVPVGIGGYAFTLPSKLKKVDVRDLNGNGVRVSVCQENDQQEGEIPGNCGGEGDDVSISFCTTGSPKDVSDQNFKANSPFTVFVRSDGPAFGCDQVGVGGTLRVVW